MTAHHETDQTLRRRLLDGLAGIGGMPDRGMAPRGADLFSYCCFERERLASMPLPVPVLGIVLSGRKEVWRGETGLLLDTGSAFALPKDLELDFFNIPDERRGLYQSLILEVEAPPRLLTAGPSARRPEGAAPFGEIQLTASLVETLIHAAREISAGPGEAEIRSARRDELLALLRQEPAAAALFPQTVADRVAALVAATPAHPWTAEDIARRIGVSVATLRRKLDREGASLRQVLRRERMQAARVLIDAQGVSSEGAAQAVGYTSRSHFARQFRSEIGRNPRRGGHA